MRSKGIFSSQKGPDTGPFRTGLTLILPVILLVITFGTGPDPAHKRPPALSFSTEGLRQGGVARVELRTDQWVRSVKGRFLEKEVFFFESGGDGKRTFRTLVGTDLSTRPGLHIFEVMLDGENGSGRRHFYSVVVTEGGYEVERLTLPEAMVKPGAGVLKRIEMEKKTVERVVNNPSKERFWSGPFIMPVEGRITSGFGLKRILNGRPGSVHSGLDIRAPVGKEVLASNRARVALTGELYFTGKTVILDHGLGLFTLYCHLSEIRVEEGDVVDKASVIGLAGSTGRTTGPHLHWGVYLNGSRVNPADLVTVTEAAERDTGAVVTGAASG